MYRRFIKRVLDIIFSLLGLVVLFPVFLIVSILVRKYLGSPVIFRQERPGLNEEIFVLYKFRTMTEKRNDKNELLPDDMRLNKFGKILRSSSLDEIPELLNILKGDMSFVGPRPLVVRYLPFYSDEERTRHTVRPGLTGLAQVNGRNSLNWDDRLKLDVHYVNEMSLILDLKILFSTIKKVLLKEDILVGEDHVLKNLDIERKGKD